MASKFSYTLTAMPSTPLTMGFGGEVCNSATLQVTFLDAGGNKIDPSAADLKIIPSLDGTNFGSAKVGQWTYGTQANGDVVDLSGGPWGALQLSGSFTLGSATKVMICVAANHTGRLI